MITYSHSWIFGCSCAHINARYASAEKIYNRSGLKYKLINYVEARYYKSGGKWLKSHVIHCKVCGRIPWMKYTFLDKPILCSGVFMT